MCQIKEDLCSVSYDLELDNRLAEETTVLVESFTLPDSRVIKLGQERFEASECPFRPHLTDVEQLGSFLRPSLFGHIVLSGGSSTYPGLASRLEKE